MKYSTSAGQHLEQSVLPYGRPTALIVCSVGGQRELGEYWIKTYILLRTLCLHPEVSHLKGLILNVCL